MKTTLIILLFLFCIFILEVFFLRTGNPPYRWRGFISERLAGIFSEIFCNIFSNVLKYFQEQTTTQLTGQREKPGSWLLYTGLVSSQCLITFCSCREHTAQRTLRKNLLLAPLPSSLSTSWLVCPYLVWQLITKELCSTEKYFENSNFEYKYKFSYFIKFNPDDAGFQPWVRFILPLTSQNIFRQDVTKNGVRTSQTPSHLFLGQRRWSFPCIEATLLT